MQPLQPTSDSAAEALMQPLQLTCGLGCVSARGCGPRRPPILHALPMLHARPWLRIDREREREGCGDYTNNQSMRAQCYKVTLRYHQQLFSISRYFSQQQCA